MDFPQVEPRQGAHTRLQKHRPRTRPWTPGRRRLRPSHRCMPRGSQLSWRVFRGLEPPRESSPISLEILIYSDNVNNVAPHGDAIQGVSELILVHIRNHGLSVRLTLDSRARLVDLENRSISWHDRDRRNNLCCIRCSLIMLYFSAYPCVSYLLNKTDINTQ